jgi:ABC-2 type transport system permease protein
MNVQTFPILIRRELWEHRVLWIAPLVLAALYIAGCILLGGTSLGNIETNAGFPRTSSSNGTFLFVMIQLTSTAILFALMSIVLFFYLTDCLYAERKDRSILFWKSLPVSDSATVLSKLVTALLVVPLGVFVVAVITNLLAFAILWVWIRGNPFLQQFLQWDTLTWLRLYGTLLMDVLIVAVWYAPVAAYQLLVSAWAKSNVFVWTVLPPLALSVGEWAVFGTWNIGKIILQRLMFNPPEGTVAVQGAAQGIGGVLNQISAAGLLATPALWIGLAIAGLLVFAAIRIRRYRDDT